MKFTIALDEIEMLLDTAGVIIELGAGMAVPTVRRYSELVSTTCKAPLIRINVREPGVRAGNLWLAMGALAGLQGFEAKLAWF